MERSQQGGACARCAAAPKLTDRARRAILQTLLALAAITLWVLLFAAFAAIGGCSQKCGPVQQMSCSHAATRCVQGRLLARQAPRPSLIFTAEPGLTPIPADEITRADWPTTPGRYSSGQSVYYQENWYDTQGLGRYDFNYGYRTFTSSRTGQQSAD